MNYLLDTVLVSELRSGRDSNVVRWAENTLDDPWFLSVLTFGEIRKGIERLRPRDPIQAESIQSWMGRLRAEFAGQVLEVDSFVADEWGRINAPANRPLADSLIAATARVHGLTVATRNTADFESCGVAVVNPWEFSS